MTRRFRSTANEQESSASSGKRFGRFRPGRIHCRIDYRPIAYNGGGIHVNIAEPADAGGHPHLSHKIHGFAGLQTARAPPITIVELKLFEGLD